MNGAGRTLTPAKDAIANKDYSFSGTGGAMIYKPMEAAEIVGIMRRRGVSIVQLAQEAGEPPEAVALRLQKTTIDDNTACKYMDALQEIKRKGVKMERTRHNIEVIQHIAVLRKYKGGGTLELNITTQDDHPEKWDLRRWWAEESGDKIPGRGITLDEAELAALRKALEDLYGAE